MAESWDITCWNGRQSASAISMLLRLFLASDNELNEIFEYLLLIMGYYDKYIMVFNIATTTSMRMRTGSDRVVAMAMRGKSGAKCLRVCGWHLTIWEVTTTRFDQVASSSSRSSSVLLTKCWMQRARHSGVQEYEPNSN